MKKLSILILSLLFSSYVSAQIHNKNIKNKTSINTYSQSKTNTTDSNRCVWPPCDDEW
ncbi:Uncharacterised protein [Proteus vulgaris]|jgi:hypothetical protein|uniref:Uncharacterized protein n=1 Tax=Proteus vulgaris TaxID=585 RepID=A0A379F5U6_PROVU|nr:Uncharacterised protein [Proteus vulgaris]